MVLLHLDALTQWSTLLGAIRTAVPCQMLWPTLPVCFGRISQTPSASAKNNEASLSHRDAGADSFPCCLYQSDRHSFFRLFLTWLLHHLILEMFPEQNTVNFVCFTMKSENKTANSNAFTHLYAFLCFAKPSRTVRMQRARRWCQHFISPGQKYHVDFSLHLILADAATFIRCMNMWCFLM